MGEVKGRIFSGVQPTGNLHLGNYLGAIRNWTRLQDDFDCLYCVVDLHAITVPQDPDGLRANTREVTAGLLAAGIDPKSNIIFNQSQVAAHAELAWIFNCIARLGWLNRMTQFKEKAGKHRENATVGLYAYPTLMAADILVYQATHVPVGDDQKQHLELARDIAQAFNSMFEPEFFPQPEPIIQEAAARVMSLRDGLKKMSKSDASEYSRLNMADGADEIARKIRKARTDSDPLPGEPAGLVSRPEAANLVGIYAALTDRLVSDVCGEYADASFSDFKAKLTEVAVEVLAPVGEEMKRLMRAPGDVDAVLRDGGERAEALAAPIIAEAKRLVGFLQP